MFGKYKYTNTKYTWDGACFQIIGDSEHGNGEASPQRVLLAYAAAAGSAGAAIGERAAFKALVDRVRAGLEFLVSGVCVSCLCVCVCVCVCAWSGDILISARPPHAWRAGAQFPLRHDAAFHRNDVPRLWARDSGSGAPAPP
jgi:hypothetical protein